jgi:hypothetical protein
MSRLDASDVPWSDLYLCSVIHRNAHATRESVEKVRRLAAICPCDGLHMFRPSPPRLERPSEDRAATDIDDLRLPLSANGRISSGESKLFTSIVATSPLLSGVGFRQLSACVDVDFLPLTTIYLRRPLSITKNSGRLVADPLPERGGAPQPGVWD